jgi:hypothetical protein
MSDPTVVDNEIRFDCAPEAGGGITVSRVLSGPLAALGAIRYELGRDEVWVIGRLPETAPVHSRERRRAVVRPRSV